MKEKTYLKMTKKQPFRRFKLFKQKYLTKPRLYAFLAKIKLVREVTKYDIEPIYNNSIINKVTMLDEKITTDRGVFNLSFCTRGEKHYAKQWYETKFSKKPKTLFVVYDKMCAYLTVEVHAECEQFEVRLDPFTHVTVRRQNPRFTVKFPKFEKVTAFTSDDDIGVFNFKSYEVNFLNARFADKYTIQIDPDNIKEDNVWECLKESIIRLKNYLNGNNEVINEKLIGVVADGEFITEDGQRLLPNCLCRRCGNPLFKSSVEGYTAQCIFCDEDFYDIEVRKVDPKQYEMVYDFTKELLYHELYE